MKNIHVLPTGITIAGIEMKNIYITSNEEIKDGYVFYSKNQEVLKVKGVGEKSKEIFHSKGFSYPNDCKKIILTTDQDLIKDGVQAIDDEFLEWFVKNPSFEEVLVEKLFKDDFGFWVSYLDLLQNEPLREVESKYNIIFPKKEVEQNCEFCKQPIGKYGCACAKQKEEAKQETLEEVARNYRDLKLPDDLYDGFIAGAKWQQEKSCNHSYILTAEQGHRVIKCSKCNDTQPI